MNIAFKFLLVIGALSLPATAFAASGCSGEGLERVICTIGTLVGALMPIVVAIALLAFFWGLAMYVLNFSGEDKDKKKGRDMMVYGILALFVMVSVWGIVGVLQNTFFKGGIDNEMNDIPCLDFPGAVDCDGGGGGNGGGDNEVHI